MFSNNNLSGATKRVYDYLYEEIISNRLTPGTALSELDIAKRLSSSRSPVREATMALEGEGLVRRYPGRGCFVAEITTQDVKEIFELRILLEVAALRQSYAMLDPASLQDLEERLTALDESSTPEAYYDTDRRLHEMVIGNCGNVRLMQILRTLNGQIEQFRHISARRPQRLKESRVEHLSIVRALIDQDLDAACQRLTEHIKNVQACTESVCMQMGTTGGFLVSY